MSQVLPHTYEGRRAGRWPCCVLRRQGERPESWRATCCVGRQARDEGSNVSHGFRRLPLTQRSPAPPVIGDLTAAGRADGSRPAPYGSLVDAQVQYTHISSAHACVKVSWKTVLCIDRLVCTKARMKVPHSSTKGAYGTSPHCLERVEALQRRMYTPEPHGGRFFSRAIFGFSLFSR